MKSPSLGKISRLLSLAMIALILAGCASGPDGSEIPDWATSDSPVVATWLSGLNDDGLNRYVDWWRQPSRTSAANTSQQMGLMDPSCGLEYAYDKMADFSQLKDPLLGTGFMLADRGAAQRFISGSEQEALIILRGYSFLSRGDAVYCNTKAGRQQLYLPVRLSLKDGAWEIDGYASVGAVITIEITADVLSAPLNTIGDAVEDGSGMFYSPMRLARFRVTDTNRERVLDFARVTNRIQVANSLVMHWFRQEDVNPYFEQVASETKYHGSCPAFRNGGDCGVGFPMDLNDQAQPWYLDHHANQSNETIRNNPISGPTMPTLDKLASKSAASADVAKLREQLQANGLDEALAPPAEFGGWAGVEAKPADYFAVWAFHGTDAYLHAAATLKDHPALKPWVGYAGVIGTGGDTRSITLTPTYSQTAIGGDFASFYERNSLLNLNGEGGTSVVGATPFSTASSQSHGTGLRFHQGPLTRISIHLQDALRAENSSTYTSTLIPTQFLGRNGPEDTRSVNYSLLFDTGRALNAFLLNFLYDAYTSTFGAGVSSLTRLNTSNLLSVPTIERWKVAFYDYSGDSIRPVYETRSIDELQGAAKITCEALRGATKLVDKWNPDPNSPTFSKCYQQNDLYVMWEFVKNLGMLFVLGYMVFYFVMLQTQARRIRIPPLGFLLRVVIAFALLLSLETIIRFLATLTAEVILLTNLIGSQMQNGEPYSYLWLFSGFLNTPARDYSLLLLFAIAPFAALALIVLMLFIFLRLGLVMIMVVLSPIWVWSIISDPQMSFFTTSLRVTLRMYLIPLISLVLILLMFALLRVFDVGPQSGPVIMAAISIFMLIALSIIPWMASHWVVRGPMTAIKTTLQTATDAAEGSDYNTWLGSPEATGSSAGLGTGKMRDPGVASLDRRLGDGTRGGSSSSDSGSSDYGTMSSDSSRRIGAGQADGESADQDYGTMASDSSRQIGDGQAAGESAGQNYGTMASDSPRRIGSVETNAPAGVAALLPAGRVRTLGQQGQGDSQQIEMQHSAELAEQRLDKARKQFEWTRLEAEAAPADETKQKRAEAARNELRRQQRHTDRVRLMAKYGLLRSGSDTNTRRSPAAEHQRAWARLRRADTLLAAARQRVARGEPGAVEQLAMIERAQAQRAGHFDNALRARFSGPRKVQERQYVQAKSRLEHVDVQLQQARQQMAAGEPGAAERVAMLERVRVRRADRLGHVLDNQEKKHRFIEGRVSHVDRLIGEAREKADRGEPGATEQLAMLERARAQRSVRLEDAALPYLRTVRTADDSGQGLRHRVAQGSLALARSRVGRAAIVAGATAINPALGAAAGSGRLVRAGISTTVAASWHAISKDLNSGRSNVDGVRRSVFYALRSGHLVDSGWDEETSRGRWLSERLSRAPGVSEPQASAKARDYFRTINTRSRLGLDAGLLGQLRNEAGRLPGSRSLRSLLARHRRSNQPLLRPQIDSSAG